MNDLTAITVGIILVFVSFFLGTILTINHFDRKCINASPIVIGDKVYSCIERKLEVAR